MPDKKIADTDYGCEENYTIMEKQEIEAYVKHNYFHKEQKRNFRNNHFLTETFDYNGKEDYTICYYDLHQYL